MEKAKEGIGDLNWASNASTTKIIYKGGKFEILEYGKNDYMQGYITNLPINL